MTSCAVKEKPIYQPVGTLRDGWEEDEAEDDDRVWSACEKHLQDLRQHQTPLASLKAKAGIPQSVRRVALP